MRFYIEPNKLMQFILRCKFTYNYKPCTLKYANVLITFITRGNIHKKEPLWDRRRLFGHQTELHDMAKEELADFLSRPQIFERLTGTGQFTNQGRDRNIQ